ncbi:MAG: hypothetical protein HY259_12335 [Chloroflexi bacterium]|nr:hypothetical protein [Chloroflexota bacterium]
MKKRFPLLYYQTYHHSWRGSALTLLVVAGGLRVWGAPALRDYEAVLTLAAGLGALVWVLGSALSRMAFVAVSQDSLAIQLPLWRVRFPFEAMTLTRLVAFDSISPSKAEDDWLRDRSALVVELKRWPMPFALARFWLGREFAAPNRVVLLVADWASLRQGIEAGIARKRVPF